MSEVNDALNLLSQALKKAWNFLYAVFDFFAEIIGIPSLFRPIVFPILMLFLICIFIIGIIIKLSGKGLLLLILIFILLIGLSMIGVLF